VEEDDGRVDGGGGSGRVAEERGAHGGEAQRRHAAEAQRRPGGLQKLQRGKRGRGARAGARARGVECVHRSSRSRRAAERCVEAEQRARSGGHVCDKR